MVRAAFCVSLLLLVQPAHAVIVRGRVTSPLGVPVTGARIQLILLTGGSHSVASAVAGTDGGYELRTDQAGEFLLLATSVHFAPQIGNPFYAGRTDLVTRVLALDLLAVTPQLTTQPTLFETPFAQVSTPVAQLRPDQFLTEAMLLPELRSLPSVFLLQLGQTGAPAALYLRGAPPEAIETMIDGVSAENLGGGFNYGTVSSSALAALTTTPAVELSPVANPLDLLDASGGIVSLHTPRTSTIRPALTYSGDAGSLANVRNEVVASALLKRAEALLSFSRFDTGNEGAPFHLATSGANLGYQISANTGLRFTLRNEVSAGALPSPLEIFGIPPSGRLAEQDLYSAFTFETQTSRAWHNQLRFGIARKRSEALNFFTPVTGVPITIVGANGYSTSGIAAFVPLPAREDFVTNRDVYAYQTDAPLLRFLRALLIVRYEEERAADLTPALRNRVGRHHLSVAGELEGAFRARFFYAASGFFDHSALLGSVGAPRLGLTYVPVRPGARRLRGTSLHATAASGVNEPGLDVQTQEAYPVAARSRTFDLSVDQNLLAQKLILHAGYFHNQFSHQAERLTPAPQAPLFAQPISQTLGFRSQGLELHLRYQPFLRLSVQGGYTFLAALVEQSATLPVFNPNLPGVAIGALSALPGARPFHRPPHTGFFAVEYTGTHLTAAFRGALASHSDDSTNLFAQPALLLPNRDLSPAYASLDANASYAFSRRITAYTQLTNLTDSRHIAPIGYLSTPFVIRAGLRLRIGGE